MDIRELRRQNLDRLIGNPGLRGRIIDFAQQYDFDPTYISQILNGYKKMGEKSARKTEETMGLPKGTLDTLPDTSPKPATEDESELLRSYRAMRPEVKEAFLRYVRAVRDSHK